jgi:hypothetical protein
MNDATADWLRTGGVSKHHPHFCPGSRARVRAIGYGPFISKIVIADQGDLVPDGNPDRDEILSLPGAAGHPERRT